MGQERLLEHMRHTNSFVYTGGMKTPRRNSTMTLRPASPDASLCIVKLLVGLGLSLFVQHHDREECVPGPLGLSLVAPTQPTPFGWSSPELGAPSSQPSSCGDDKVNWTEGAHLSERKRERNQASDQHPSRFPPPPPFSNLSFHWLFA